MITLDKINRRINEALWIFHNDPDEREAANARARFKRLSELRRAVLSKGKA